MQGYVVREPFTRVNPVTGRKHVHQKGDVIHHPERIKDLAGSLHEHHLVAVHLPDPAAAHLDRAEPELEATERALEHGEHAQE
jgi:hypothetical protein